MSKKKIFIVDDDKSFLDSIEMVLVSKDFDVLKASTGEIFYTVLEKEKPDLILLDINLPGKDGFQILEEIKSNEKFSKLPIIMITGDTTAHIDRAFSKGADDCVFKPIIIEDLILRIQKLIK